MIMCDEKGVKHDQWSYLNRFTQTCLLSSFCSTTLTYLRRSFNQMICVALWSFFSGSCFIWFHVIFWLQKQEHHADSTVQFCTLLYRRVQYCTVQYSTVQYCTVLYSTVQYSTVLFCTVLYSTVQYSTVLYTIVQHCTVLYKLRINSNHSFGLLLQRMQSYEWEANEA